MLTNEHGLEMSGTAEAIDLYDSAVNHVLHMDEKCTAAAEASVLADPNCIMGRVLECYLRLLSTETEDAGAASNEIQDIAELVARVDATPRERAHLAALSRWAGGDWHKARSALLRLQRDYPRDILALMAGHQLDIFTGDLALLRDRVAEVLPAWTPDDRHLGVVLGMYAFGLEECGQLSKADDIGQRAIELDPEDAWGLHAVAHVFETRGEFHAGTRFMSERRDDWSSSTNFFAPHNWWHVGLYMLEAGQVDAALQVYDQELHNPSMNAGSMQLLDAAALLWRRFLAGDRQPDRWRALAEAWKPLSKEPHFAFNDMHAVMAYTASEDMSAAWSLIADRRHALEGDRNRTTYRDVANLVGFAVFEALVHYGSGNYAMTVELLLPLREKLYAIGGSNAQRDVVHQTLLEAAIRSGQSGVAAGLVSGRLQERPCSPYNWLKLAQIRHADGDFDGSDEANRRAQDFSTADG